MHLSEDSSSYHITNHNCLAIQKDDMFMDGSDGDLKELFLKRQNLTSYVKFIAKYGPCVVPNIIWKDHSLVKHACAKSEKNTCMFYLFFTASDEAFLLLVLKNYAERWYAEKKWECAEKW